MRSALIYVSIFLCGIFSGLVISYSKSEQPWNPILISFNADHIRIADKNNIAAVWYTTEWLKGSEWISFCIADGVIWPMQSSDDGSFTCRIEDIRGH